MISDCDKKHPLQRDGLSQKQRLLRALKPDYVRIDERKLPQLLAFAKRYAQQLQYYDGKNKAAGDWQSFLEKDVTTVLADILSKNDQIERRAIEQIKAVTTNATEINTPEMKSAFKLLFQIVATMAIQLDYWFRRSMEGLRLHTELERLISSSAAEMLRKGICWFKAGMRNGGYFEGVEALPFEEAEDKLVNLSQLGSHNFHPVWIPKSSGMTDLSWRAYFETLPHEDSVFTSIAEAESQLFAFFQLSMMYKYNCATKARRLSQRRSNPGRIMNRIWDCSLRFCNCFNTPRIVLTSLHNGISIIIWKTCCIYSKSQLWPIRFILFSNWQNMWIGRLLKKERS